MFPGFVAKGPLFLFASLAAAQGASPLYKDPNASIDDRVSDLLRRMTIEEKSVQLLQGTLIELPIDSSVYDG
jgi:beta-glucosidase